MTTVHDPTKQQTGRTGPRLDWTPLLAALGGLVGGAAWVGVLGTAVVWQRLQRIGVPPVPAVAEMSNELRIVLGVRYLAVPMALALLGIIVLVLMRDDDDRGENRRDQTPRGLREALVLLVAFGVIAVWLSGLRWEKQLGLIVAVCVCAVVTFGLVRRTDGFVKGSVVFFGAVLVLSGGGGLAFERLREPRFNVGAIVRKDNSALGGFVIGRGDNSVLMVVPQLPDGQPAVKLRSLRAGRQEVQSSRTTSPSSRPAKQRCGNAAAARRGSSAGGRRCYVNRLVIVASDEINKLIVGPRGQRVGLDSYELALRLASRARDRPDEAKDGQSRSTQRRGRQ